MAPGMGFEPMRIRRSTGSQGWLTIKWVDIRADYVVYLNAQRYCDEYKEGLLRYLDKYFIEISSPTDIMRIFANLKKGGRHLWLGFKTIFNFLEASGYDLNILTIYRKALPTFQCGIDLRVPQEQEIIQSLAKLRDARPELAALYNLLLDSGLRLIEVVKAVKKIDSAEPVNDFYRIPLADFRGCKSAFYGYLTKETYDQILAAPKVTLTRRQCTDYFRGRGSIIKVTAPKYIRKFFFDKALELGIPESVCDFYEGRLPRTVGARHYCNLRRQADKFYQQKYLRYLKKLRTKVTT
jgi:intergrase/recombinase